jgi:hypothetical protein
MRGYISVLLKSLDPRRHANPSSQWDNRLLCVECYHAMTVMALPAIAEWQERPETRP